MTKTMKSLPFRKNVNAREILIWLIWFLDRHMILHSNVFSELILNFICVFWTKKSSKINKTLNVNQQPVIGGWHFYWIIIILLHTKIQTCLSRNTNLHTYVCICKKYFYFKTCGKYFPSHSSSILNFGNTE